jgi:DNA-binding MarR family transcriptional regulator
MKTWVRNEVVDIPFDVCAGNHGGNAESRAANLKTDKATDLRRILDFMETRPGTETYVKEIIAALGIKHQTASARLTDLKAAGKIEVVPGKRIEGCGVVRLVRGQGRLF